MFAERMHRMFQTIYDNSNVTSLTWTTCVYSLVAGAPLIILHCSLNLIGSNSFWFSKFYADVALRSMFQDQYSLCQPIIAIKNSGLYVAGGEFGSISTMLGTIHMLREKCAADVIVIGHCEELKPNAVKVLKSLKDILVKNLCIRFNEKQMLRFKSYYCRHLSVVHSFHRHIGLIDNDMIWFKSPSVLTEPLISRNTSGFMFNTIHMKYSFLRGPNYLVMNELLIYLSQYMDRPNIDGNSLLQNSVMRNVSNFAYDSSYVYYNAASARPALKFLNKMLNIYHYGFADQEAYWISAVIRNVSFEPDLWSTTNYVMEPPFFCDLRRCGCNNHILHYHPLEKNNASLLAANVGSMVEVKSKHWAMSKFVHYDCSKLPLKYAARESVNYSTTNFNYDPLVTCFQGEFVKHYRYDTVSEDHIRMIQDRRFSNGIAMQIELALSKVI